MISIYVVVHILSQGYVWGQPAKGQPSGVISDANENPFAFYKTVAAVGAGALLFGLLFAISLAGYIYRIRLDRRR
jgi:hypothetical protein